MPRDGTGRALRHREPRGARQGVHDRSLPDDAQHRRHDHGRRSEQLGGQSVLPVLGPAQRVRLRRVAVSAEPRLQPDRTADGARLLGARRDPRRLHEESPQTGGHMMNGHILALGLAGGILAASFMADAVLAQAEAEPAHPTPERLFNATIKEKSPDQDIIANGRLVASGGARKGGAAMACFTCHGTDGAGDAAGAVPRLAGLPAWYIYKQLNDYAGGSRDSASMTGIARQLTESEREAVASYYALLDAPHPPKPPAGDLRMLQWGQQLAAVGATDRAVPACLNCHGPDGSGLPPSV